jgi:hypothetical protein
MYKIINPSESIKETLNYIELNRNWSVQKQKYKDISSENCKAKLTECEIIKRGNYVLIEYKGIVHFWEKADTNYPYFQMAIDFMEVINPKKWKTIDKLISLREAIRQTEVNCCYFVEDILEGKKLTLKTYNYFMQLSRKQDFEHHGSNTF